jgi:putative endonuclease
LCHAALRESATRGAVAAAERTQPRTPRDGRAADDSLRARAASKRSIGAAFEARALEYLKRQQMRLVARNVSCRGGEIDLVMRDGDGTLVFVEVRARGHARFGGAAASIGWHKQRRIVRAAQYFLARSGGAASACRFDVIAFDGVQLVWLRDAFRADDA